MWIFRRVRHVRTPGGAGLCLGGGGCAVASRDSLLASQWVSAAANFECGGGSRRVTRDRALDLEVPNHGRKTAGQFRAVLECEEEGDSCGRSGRQGILRTYVWEVGVLALCRQRTPPAAPHSRASWLSWSPSAIEAAGFSGVGLARRDPCCSALRDLSTFLSSVAKSSGREVGLTGCLSLLSHLTRAFR